ncbi:hypothetical protein TNCT_704521 [Trichonephila clavata]|uniref:Uncharacterized protein n=1 Tax=Trichonephila clavata TaxID=2740835 RepID=A0A8X6LVD7_TRICU|nr:hypothetical protein TNCT_704521 [Trichonephila clavata]
MNNYHNTLERYNGELGIKVLKLKLGFKQTRLFVDNGHQFEWSNESEFLGRAAFKSFASAWRYSSFESILSMEMADTEGHITSVGATIFFQRLVYLSGLISLIYLYHNTIYSDAFDIFSMVLI